MFMGKALFRWIYLVKKRPKVVWPRFRDMDQPCEHPEILVLVLCPSVLPCFQIPWDLCDSNGLPLFRANGFQATQGWQVAEDRTSVKAAGDAGRLSSLSGLSEADPHPGQHRTCVFCRPASSGPVSDAVLPRCKGPSSMSTTASGAGAHLIFPIGKSWSPDPWMAPTGRGCFRSCCPSESSQLSWGGTG